MYNPVTDSWEVITSHMGTLRRDCIAAVVPDNQLNLMVVGGYISSDFDKTNSVKFASVDEIP